MRNIGIVLQIGDRLFVSQVEIGKVVRAHFLGRARNRGRSSFASSTIPQKLTFRVSFHLLVLRWRDPKSKHCSTRNAEDPHDRPRLRFTLDVRKRIRLAAQGRYTIDPDLLRAPQHEHFESIRPSLHKTAWTRKKIGRCRQRSTTSSR